MVHHVYANRSNIGDWLSARAIQSLLPPAVPLREHLCDAYFVDRTLAALREVRSDEDVVVIGGGGLFMDYFTPFWRGFAELAPGLTFVIWGVGACDMKERHSRLPLELVQEIVRHSRLTVVRDELTREFLGLPGQLHPPVHCPSLLHLRPPARKQHRLLHAVHYEVTGPQRYEELCALCRDFADVTGREYTETNNEIQADSVSQLERTLDLYRSADLVVSTRLHGCLAGLAMGCKVLAVSGDCKVEELMKVAGLGRWTCDIGQIEAVRSRLQDLQAQPTPTRFLEDVRAENQEVGRLVTRIIEEHHTRERRSA